MDSPSNKTKIISSTTADCSSNLTLHDGHPEPPQPPPVVVASYQECRRNHAARLGMLAMDGCQEFVASTSAGPAATAVPAYLVCAACGCHRNFHRCDYSTGPGPAPSPPSQRPLSPVPTSYYAPVNWYGGFPAIPGPAASTLLDGKEEDDDDHRRRSEMKARRKRERTKFSKEQKEKMEAFAEKVGWKMSGSNDDDESKKTVEEFCREAGVGRDVLRTWMNNHKPKIRRNGSG